MNSASGRAWWLGIFLHGGNYAWVTTARSILMTVLENSIQEQMQKTTNVKKIRTMNTGGL
jgi:hypothetical protein